MKSEKSIVDKASLMLADHGWYVIKIHGSEFQESGLPDVLAIKHGFHCWIEFKRGSEKPTPRQVYMMEKLGAFGARCFWTNDPTYALWKAERERDSWENQENAGAIHGDDVLRRAGGAFGPSDHDVGEAPESG